MALPRRQLLKHTGTATLATVGATCIGAVAAQDAGNGELPAYNRWLALENGGLEFIYADWASLEEYVLEDLEEQEPGQAAVPAAFEGDPMVAPASDGLLWAFFFVGIDLAQYRLGRLLDDDEAFASTVEELILANEAFVVTGDIDPAEIDAQLTAQPEAEFLRQLEQTDEIDGYDIYTPTDEAVDAAIALDSDALVVVDGEELEVDDDPVAVLETTIGASETDRATDDSETFAQLLEIAGDGDLTVGQVGDRVGADGVLDLAFAELENAEEIVSSLTIEDAETATGEFAAIVDDPDEATLEEVLGASGDEQSVDVDGDLVTATATWREQDVTVGRIR